MAEVKTGDDKTNTYLVIFSDSIEVMNAINHNRLMTIRIYRRSLRSNIRVKVAVTKRANPGATSEMGFYQFEKLILKALTSDKVQVQVRSLLNEELAKAFANLPTKTLDSLGAAKERGASYARAEWEKPENLSLQEAAKYCGRSDRVVNEARMNGEYYGLLLEGTSRGYRYPLWQFDAESDRLTKILSILNAFEVSCWVKHNFLLRPNSLLGGRSPHEVILDHNADLSQLIKVANNRFDGDQGAS